MTSLATIWWMASKELRCVLRDRRVLVSTLLLPMCLMPVMLYAPLLVALRAQQSVQQDIQVVHVVGIDDDMMTTLRNHQLDPQPGHSDAQAREAVRSKAIEAALVYDNGTFHVVGRLGGGVNQSTVVMGKLHDVLRSRKDALVERALVQAGTPTSVLQPFAVVDVDVSAPAEQSAGALGFLVPMFLVLFMMMGGSPVAIDATAGEKEKGTLEALLTTPVPRAHLLMGKCAAVCVMALLSTSCALVGLLGVGGLIRQVLMRAVAGTNDEDKVAMLGGGINVGAVGVVWMVVTCMLFAVFISAVLVAVGMYARSFKEAQSYLMPVQMLMLLPMIGLQFSDFIRAGIGVYAVPVVNTMWLIDGITKDTATISQALVTWASTTAASAAALWFAHHVFQRENVVFRN
jgi:sodium transport system permease protein